MFNLILASVVLPLIAIILLWRRARRPAAPWVATFVLALGVAGFSFLAAPWGYVGLPVRYAIAALFLAATIYSLARNREGAEESPVRMLVKILIGLFFGSVAVGVLRAHAQPSNAVDLRFPFGRGTYLVLHGGSTPPANAYSGRGAQSYSVDFVKLNRFGRQGEAIKVEIDPCRVPCGDVIVKTTVTGPVLHVNAERNGQPVPITFEGRWLVRNAIVRR